MRLLEGSRSHRGISSTMTAATSALMSSGDCITNPNSICDTPLITLAMPRVPICQWLMSRCSKRRTSSRSSKVELHPRRELDHWMHVIKCMGDPRDPRISPKQWPFFNRHVPVSRGNPHGMWEECGGAQPSSELRFSCKISSSINPMCESFNGIADAQRAPADDGRCEAHHRHLPCHAGEDGCRGEAQGPCNEPGGEGEELPGQAIKRVSFTQEIPQSSKQHKLAHDEFTTTYRSSSTGACSSRIVYYKTWRLICPRTRRESS